MKSKVAKRILENTPKEIKDKAREHAEKLLEKKRQDDEKKI